jgi:hypothetical protein
MSYEQDEERRILAAQQDVSNNDRPKKGSALDRGRVITSEPNWLLLPLLCAV